MQLICHLLLEKSGDEVDVPCPIFPKPILVIATSLCYTKIWINEVEFCKTNNWAFTKTVLCAFENIQIWLYQLSINKLEPGRGTFVEQNCNILLIFLHIGTITAVMQLRQLFFYIHSTHKFYATVLLFIYIHIKWVAKQHGDYFADCKWNGPNAKSLYCLWGWAVHITWCIIHLSNA